MGIEPWIGKWGYLLSSEGIWDTSVWICGVNVLLISSTWGIITNMWGGLENHQSLSLPQKKLSKTTTAKLKKKKDNSCWFYLFIVLMKYTSSIKMIQLDGNKTRRGKVLYSWEGGRKEDMMMMMMIDWLLGNKRLWCFSLLWVMSGDGKKKWRFLLLFLLLFSFSFTSTTIKKNNNHPYCMNMMI